MKQLFTLIVSFLSVTTLFAQPVLSSGDLHTGLGFNLYSLSNVNTSNLALSGADITWDVSTATATLAGTCDFLEMSATPYQAEYPAANFAMKFTSIGSPANYSLFNLSNSVLEEVANNVGTSGPVSFLNYRTTIVFPFTFNMSNTDTYQKENQEVKTITNTYDAYGTFLSNGSTNNNVVRIYTDDNGNIAPVWWNSSPLIPLFQASSSGLILWTLTSTTTGILKIHSNRLFDMYPNPATNQLNIINKELISKIEIYNTAGQLQFSTTNSGIDISSLKNGIYFLKAFSEKGSFSQKFVKE